MYALIETGKKNGLYASSNGGKKWYKISEDEQTGNRPFYYADIRVDPQNEDRIYSLWTYITRSDDGGKSWNTITPYSRVHPDHHAMWINPKDSKLFVQANDGGTNVTHNGGKT